MPDMYDQQRDELAWAEDFLTTKAKVAKMMECPACGEDIPADSKKCPECGYSLKTASSSSGGAEGPMKGRVARKSYECPSCGAFNMLAAKACHTCGNNFHKGGKGGGGGGGGAASPKGGGGGPEEMKSKLSQTRPPDDLEKMAGVTKPVPSISGREAENFRQMAARREGPFKGQDDLADDVYWKAHGVINDLGARDRALAKLYRSTQRDHQKAQSEAHDAREQASYIRRHGSGSPSQASQLDREAASWEKRAGEYSDRMSTIRERVPNVQQLH